VIANRLQTNTLEDYRGNAQLERVKSTAQYFSIYPVRV
jgi:hypothetical protein